jgi:hypothetical protein
MHLKPDFPKGQHSACARLPDENPTAHSAKTATQLDKLPTTGDGTLEIWDAASGSGNFDSETVGTGLALVHGSKMGL